jgi:hypothetical protein
MKNHLKTHSALYKEYLQKMIEDNQEKVAEKKRMKELEEEAEHSQTAVSEAGGSKDPIQKRPLTQPITRYLESGKGPVKYAPDSNYQRRADLDIAIYFVTANEPFKKIESVPFRR